MKTLSEKHKEAIRKSLLGHVITAETRAKIGKALSQSILFNCDFCQKPVSDKPSSYAKKKRHFCSQRCYSQFRSARLPKEEQPRYGTGHSTEERVRRRNARSYLNHYLRDKKITRQCCEICGAKAEAHHDDYDKPLVVRWLCFKHHREHHKRIYETPELVKK